MQQRWGGIPLINFGRTDFLGKGLETHEGTQAGGGDVPKKKEGGGSLQGGRALLNAAAAKFRKSFSQSWEREIPFNLRAGIE